MGEGEAKKAILFADVVGSTKLYSTLGDDRAQSLVHDALGLLKDITEQHFGTLIKEIGDAILVTFDDVAGAASAAQFMAQYLGQTDLDENGTRLKVRIACHFGPVLQKDNDVFGNAVNLAARLLEYAKPMQVLITDEMLTALADDPPPSRSYNKLEFKGIPGEHEVHEIILASDNAEITMASIDEERPDDLLITQQITLNFGNMSFCVNADKPQLTLGRQESNDVVIASDQVSRQHAQVQYQNGKFYLVDQSFNGTLVRFENGKDAIKVHQGDLVLIGSGAIILNKDKEAIEIPFTLGMV